MMNNRLKGIYLTFAANICFVLMAIFIGYLKDTSSHTSAFFRFGTGLIFICSGAILGKWKLRFVNKPLLCLRGLLGGTAITLYFLAMTKIGIGRATLILHFYPAFAAMFAVFFLREQFTLNKIISFILAFFGIYLLTQSRGFSTDNIYVMDLIALSAALISGCAMVTIRKLHKTDSTTAIFFAQGVGGMLIVFFPGIKDFGNPGFNEIMLLILVGISGTTGQLLMTQGFKYLSAATGSILHMVIPLFSMIAGVILFNEPFGYHQVLAFILISSSCVALMVKRKRTDVL